MIDNGEYPNTDKGRSQAAGHCYSLYDKTKQSRSSQSGKKNGEQLINNDDMFTFAMEINDEKNFEETDTEYVVHGAVLIIGDRFMNGEFVPARLVKNAYQQLNGSLHDINHMGMNYVMGYLPTQNMEYVVGYHDNAQYDEKSKAVSLDIHIYKDASKASVWKSYYDICQMAQRMPNLSAFGYKKISIIQAKDLPDGVDCAIYGLKPDQQIRCMSYMMFTAASTVVHGACNEKDGCGIPLKSECTDDSCMKDDHEVQKTKELIKKVEQLNKLL